MEGKLLALSLDLSVGIKDMSSLPMVIGPLLDSEHVLAVLPRVLSVEAERRNATIKDQRVAIARELKSNALMKMMWS